MKLQTEITAGAAIVKIPGREMAMGEADEALNRALEDLAAAGVRHIFLDLSRVREIDGACVQEILTWGGRLQVLGGELALLKPALNDLNAIVTLLRDLRSYPTRHEALASVGALEPRRRLALRGPLRMLDQVLGKSAALKVPA